MTFQLCALSARARMSTMLFVLLQLWLVTLVVSSDCTNDRVAHCANDISKLRVCSAGVRCDAACSAQVQYAKCLQASGCDADMYQALLDDCFLGKMHVASAALPDDACSCSVFAGDDPAAGLAGCEWLRPLSMEEQKSLRQTVDEARWEKRASGAPLPLAERELVLLHVRERFLDLGIKTSHGARQAAASLTLAAGATNAEPDATQVCNLGAMVGELYDHCTRLAPPCDGAEFQRLNALAGSLSRQCNVSHTSAQVERRAVVDVPPFPHSEVTVVIRTVGRKSVAAAVRSALREHFPVLVIADGAAAGRRAAETLEASKLTPNVTFVELGRKWGFYGSIGANVGAYLARTAFIAFLDDDDELAVGAGDVIRDKLALRPEVDVWVPGIQYTDGRSKCTANCLAFSDDNEAYARCQQAGGLVESNVCVPIYRTSVFSVVPFTHNVVIGGEQIFMGGTLLPHTVYLVDYNHVKACRQNAFIVEWLSTDAVYLVRPHHSGFHGSNSAVGIKFKEMG